MRGVRTQKALDTLVCLIKFDSSSITNFSNFGMEEAVQFEGYAFLAILDLLIQFL
jgi:hypothetical protein